MTVSRHLTAGDLTPVIMQAEETYGTPTGDGILYGDVRDGGKFTFTDTRNPYQNWRYGTRSMNRDDYVYQQSDAGYQDSLEVRDIEGWERILEYATGSDNNGLADYDPLESRTTRVCVRTGASAWQGRTYHGCKTDSLTVRADAPGAIVQFDETVLASYSEEYTSATADEIWTSDDSPAIQWLGGITIMSGGVTKTVYPQSFSLTVENNLERQRTIDTSVSPAVTITNALMEGRREAVFEFDVWMEDLTYIRDALRSPIGIARIVLTLGIENPVQVAMGLPRYDMDGNLPDLIQDKMRQTLRFKCPAIFVSAV